MKTAFPTPSTNSKIPSKKRIGRIVLILAIFITLGTPIATLHANPYGSPGSYASYGCGGSKGYYQPPGSRWSGNCSRGSWLGTGVPNGLGWTLFGLAAASAISRPTYVAPAPVVVEQPVYVQPPVVVQQPVVTQAPLVNCNGVPCYYINGNYYPATAMQ